MRSAAVDSRVRAGSPFWTCRWARVWSAEHLAVFVKALRGVLRSKAEERRHRRLPLISVK
jgi:hypothetical protein